MPHARPCGSWSSGSKRARGTRARPTTISSPITPHVCTSTRCCPAAPPRHTALKEFAVREVERGYPVQRFIQDRTVIEDTESSGDLAVRGWRLYNYPERLAYCVTPPDFGTLIFHCRRWANGGLIFQP